MEKNRYLIKCVIMLFALFFLSQSTILTGLNTNCIVFIDANDNVTIENLNYSNISCGITQTQNSVLYVGGSGENNYSKIQDAIDDARNGNIIFVYGSFKPYYENIVINSSITLIGENQQTTIIDGSNYGSVIQIQSNFVNIRGFTIRHSGYDFFNEWDAGIVCRNAESCEISNNIIVNNYIGIYLTFCRDVIIKNNKFFSNNTASDGFICTFSYNISIIDNILGVSSNTQRDAMYLSHVTNSLVSSNYIFNYQNGLRLLRSHFNTIQKNRLHSNQMFGVQMQYCGNNVIQNNTIRGSYFGIIINYVPPSTENYMLRNDFIDNFFHAFFVELNSGKTKWYYNFWDKPRILPKAILGFSRDTLKIQTELASPVVVFDKMPNNKINNDANDDFLTFDIDSINRFSQFYRTHILFPSLLFQSNLIPTERSINYNQERSLNITNSNSSLRHINISVGDIIFMECKRYNPEHSRPTSYSDHVALYIGDDPITNEKMFVDTVDTIGPRICNTTDFENWAHHFAVGRVITATEKQRIGAVTWVKQLVFERNSPYTNTGELVFDNYQHLPVDFDLLGCWKSSILDGFGKYSQFWYCSELVWAAYYNVDKEGNLDLFQEYSQRIDLDPSGWKFPWVVTAVEILNDDDVEIYYKDPLT